MEQTRLLVCSMDVYSKSSDISVALVSTGLGRVLRGFEAFTSSLYDALTVHVPDLNVTLFQGGRCGRREAVVVPNLHRADIPAKWFGPLSAGLLEKRSFALALYPTLVRKGYDVVHYNDLAMGSALYHLRRWFGGGYRLLYCNGAPSPPLHYAERCDMVQLLSRPDGELALSEGVASERIFQIPYGIDESRFRRDMKEGRGKIRQELGIPNDSRLILSLAAIKSEHKRIDHLIKEVGQLDNETWLLVAGQATEESRSIEALAEAHIPGRWRFVSWPHARVPELCGAADMFVLCSLTEAFGLVTIEAMMSELPVIVHDGPVFRWLTEGTDTMLIDMAARGALTAALRQMFVDISSGDCMKVRLADARSVVVDRFGWTALVPAYRNMYETVVRAGTN